MQTKNLTPFLFGAKATSRRPPQVEMTMVVRGSFKLRPGEPVTPIEGLLEQGPMSADMFRDDDEDRTGECVYASDFVDFKLRTDLLLKGTCHAPDGRPIRECPVRFTVGAWSKSLVVVGRRVWTEKMLGAAISDAHPFVTMPLGYTGSFGGPSFAPNPAGKGCDTPELPNVESPAARVRSKADRPDPAGFGPLNPAWPLRAGKVGKDYGKKWKKERAPWYAEDFDWTYFNAAPLDQQLPTYLRGDEEISFLNLHAAAQSFSARLPGLRLRAFAKDAKGTLREARMNLDTLLADLDEEALVLTWRGLVPVEEDDLADVKTVLVASEELSSQPLPETHYLAVLEAFEADPQEIEKHMPGARSTLASIEAAAKDDAAHPERTPAERALAFLETQDGSMAPPEQQAGMKQAIDKAKEMLKAPPPADPPAAPEPTATLAALVAQVGDAVTKLRELGLPQGEVEEIERMLEDPETKKAMRALTPPLPEEIGPGKDLSGRNLTRLDLSGRDLSNANFEGANLMGAKLAGACLAGASFEQAVLMDADLSSADLSGADLSRALWSGASAPGADLRGATLDQAVMDGVNLRGANLAGAKAKTVILSGADLTEANLTGCDLFKAFADGAVLTRADLTEAKLVQCTFLRTRGEGMKLPKAFLTNTSFADSDLRKAILTEARGEATNWSRADLGGADLRFVVFPAAHFMEAKAIGATFFGADLRGSEFYRACLNDAELGKANLFGANLNKCTMHGARFPGASLYGATLLGAGGKDIDLEGANLKRAMLPGS